MAVYDQEVVDAAPQYLQTKSYSAQRFRTWFADLVQAGVFSDTDWALSLLGSLAYRIAAGKAYVPGLQVADQGMYRMVSLANADLAVGAGHATLPRLDQVILRVMDNTHDGAGFNEGRIETVPGTATAGATLDNRNGAQNLATLGEASKNVLLLYDILMPAAATSISGGNVRRRAQLARIGFGALADPIPILTVAEFQALRDFPDSMEVYLLVDATNRLMWHLRYNASGSTYKWEVAGSATELMVSSDAQVLGSSIGTSLGTSIPVPVPGEYHVRSYFYHTHGPFYINLRINSVASEQIQPSRLQTTDYPAGIARKRKKTVTTAGHVIDQVTGDTGGNTGFGSFFELGITPLRVSQ